MDRGHFRRAAGSAGAVQRNASRQTNADEVGSVAGRQMVSRPGRQQWSLLGNGAGHQEADPPGNFRAALYVQSGDNKSPVSTQRIRRPNHHFIPAPVVWSGARGVSKRQERLGALARADAAASRSAAAALKRK